MVARSLAEAWKKFVQRGAGKRAQAGLLGRFALGFVLGPWLLAAGDAVPSAWGQYPTVGSVPPAVGSPTPGVGGPIQSTSQIPPPQFGDPAAMARAKLRQARVNLDQGRFDEAAKLAGEANAWRVQYNSKEDTPTKLLDEINRTRRDPKALLGASRTALQNGELDRAEQLARAAQTAQPTWQVWSDNPQKVLRDVQSARGSMPKGGMTATKPTAPAPTPAPAAPPKVDAKATAKDNARQLVQQGRMALTQGNVAQAQEMQQKAAALQADFGFWEDSPQKLHLDITRATSKAAAPASSPVPTKQAGSGVVQTQFTSPKYPNGMPQGVQPTPAASKPAPAEDPKALLRQGRDLYKLGKYDEAAKAAQMAKAKPGTVFGLFEDSPDKLLQDVERGRMQFEHQDAARCLAEGRKHLANNDLDNASKMAYKAMELKKSYSVWDLGDRPQKLLADVQSAQNKQKKPGAPTVPDSMTAKTSPTVPPTAPANLPGVANAGDTSPMIQQILVDARKALQAGDRNKAAFMVQQAKRMNPPTARQGMDNIAALEREIQLASAVLPPDQVPGAGVPTAPTGPADPKKQQAMLLLTQARQLQQEGRLVEARQKVLESRGVGATFGPSEDSPESALIQLSTLCYKRVDFLVQQSSDCLRVGNDADRFRKSEEALMQARSLAQSFGQDTQPMDLRIANVRQQSAAASGAGYAKVTANPGTQPAPVGPAPVASLPSGVQPAVNNGHQMLDQARQELRRGDSSKARKLAEGVFAGKFGLQKEAESLLRTIDAEEHGQQRIAAQRSFDAGVRAMNRKDYGQAVAILRGVNVRLLDHDKQVYLNDLLSKPELRSFMAGQGVARVSDQQPAGMPLGNVPGAPDLMKSAQAMQDVKFQQLRQQGLEIQREASDRFKAGETDRALEILQDYVADLQTIQLDNDRLALLRRPVDARLLQFKTLKSQRDFEASVLNQKSKAHDQEGKIAAMEVNKQKQVTDLMARHKTAYEEGKYKEAEMYASTALELDPDNAGAAAAVKIARIQASQTNYQKIKDQRNRMFDNVLDDAETQGEYVDIRNPLKLDAERARTINEMRKGYGKGITINGKSEKEREIEHRLQSPVNLNFNDTPLDQVLEDLHSWHGINIVPDYKALESEGVSLKRPVTIKLENVSLKSAMNLILKQLRLTYVIADEVLQVTTERNAHGKLVTTTFSVADLVIPIMNAVDTPANSLQAALDRGMAQAPSMNTNGPQPFRSPLGLNQGQNASQWTGSGPSPFASEMRPAVNTTNGPSQTMEEALIKLITNTVKPESWQAMGGPGTIEYFPLTMALVVNQAPDIQEQVFELLTALRRLQDQEVAIEIRFITIAESFFERIGLDFNINIKTDNDTAKFEPQLTSGQFKPAGFVNDFSPDRFISGLTRAGTFTSDLDIPLAVDSFGLGVPVFGGFPTGALANGGIELGLAFLSDIQVFMFLEAAQGDRRTNVMQAPKLTMYNGQTATITIQDNQWFVTNINGFQNGGQFVFIPQNFPLPLGTSVTMQPVISADRRFVRLNMGLQLQNLASAAVPLFPIVLAAQPFFEGVGNVGNPVLLTQFVQQPTITAIGVQTTVTVPDGGTVLMGGFKRMAEGRNEFGPPVLSKIPYINRLFKNVGYGREAESLMLMVTPRIIINEEEEWRQTGVGTPPP